MITFEKARNYICDTSGTDNPYLWLWERKNGIYYPVKQINEDYSYREIVINYYTDSNEFNQICFIAEDYTMEIEPYSMKHHSKYLNLDVTRFEEIKN